MRKLIYKIEAKDSGKRACDFLRREQKFSYSLVVKLRHSPESITLNGRFIRTIDKINEGDVLKVTIPETAGEIEPNEELFVPVIYEDEDIAVFDKPSNMPVHPTKGHQNDTLANYCAAKYPCSKFRVIGRLDMDTSGIVLVAKNSHAAAVLTEQEMVKKYIAITEGIPNPLKSRIDLPIDDTNPDAHRRFVSEGGRTAITDYEVINSGSGFAEVDVSPKTGRTHQIRVHFSHIGYVLVGDELYGGNRELISRQALHRYYMSFEHPVTGKKMEFVSKLPEDMQRIVNKMTEEGKCEDEQKY